MANRSILVVDDEEKNIKLMKGMLSSENYDLFGVFNGEDALATVAERQPDLILLDVMMPGMDGFEVCRRLKQDDKTRMIPIVMVTALREDEHRIRSMEVGADDFISKPVDHTELLVRIKSLLRIKSYHDELLESYREIAHKNEKLQELERIKDGLTHMIIHDLNNPLMAISGSVELILMRRGNLSERQIGVLEKCTKFCGDLNQMIRSLLDIHLMEAGELILEKKPTKMEDLIDDLLLQFKSETDSKNISLSFKRPEYVPSVNIDENIIKRVIANLINNAVRHTSERCGIEIDILCPPGEGWLSLSVRDNGKGLAREYHQKVFNKFEQVRLKQAGEKVGRSGLGLAFCKMAVESHGGTIWVESEGEGKGCTFSFNIPISIES